jgi:hypothetical protein
MTKHSNNGYTQALFLKTSFFSMPVEKIMGVYMGVGGLPVIMDMLMYQVDSQQQTFISQNFFSASGTFDPVFFGEYRDPALQLIHQGQIMRGNYNSLSGFV